MKLTLIIMFLVFLRAFSAVSANRQDGGEVTLTDQVADSVKNDKHEQSTELKEIVVTAREGERLENGSRIDREAMSHLQASSFTDLLELLPGNISKDPALTGNNSITLRETGNVGASGTIVSNDDYSITSLGTRFIVDGAPLSTDSNLQTIGTGTDATSPHYTRNVTNKGVDMRTISTDNIESVEIVRGIPGAEYGNLTSGLVNIRRTFKATPFTARFKGDEYSKLFFIGKGIKFKGFGSVLNLDLGYLDAKSDPRDIREGYKRLTGSVRFTSFTPTDLGTISWNLNGDFTGSFDNTKIDPDLSLKKIDEYSSSYRRFSLSGKVGWAAGFGWFDRIDFTGSVSLQNDILEQRKQISPTHPSVAPTSLSEGMQEGHFILGEYIAVYRSEGRPLNMFKKLVFSGTLGSGILNCNHKAGIEYSFDKNFGKGQLYDLMKPLSGGWTTRPRNFSDIPALQQISAFIQEAMTLETARSGKFNLQIGVRLQSLMGLDRKYLLSGKVYLDPRINFLWQIGDSDKVTPFVGAGLGLTTRMPTVDYLYPQEIYTDLVQLNYYDVIRPEEYSRINLRTYINNTVNYDLRAARNRKWEVRTGFSIGGNKLAVTYFDEKMTSGFRYETVYAPYTYTLYDASSISPGSLTGQPVLSDLPCEDRTVLTGYRTPSNGTKIEKRGVEFQFNSARWKSLATAVTVSGAWFESTYSNSRMLFSPVNDVIGNLAVSDRYVGLYNWNDGRRNSQFNTNFMFDTQVPRWGLVFTTSLQCMWYIKTRQLQKHGIPAFYLSADDGKLHPYTAEAYSDPFLSKLIKTYNSNLFNDFTVPIAVYLNLKASKTVGNRLTISVFVNRLLDYLPDYKVDGLTVRRNADAYFGMELNIKI